MVASSRFVGKNLERTLYYEKFYVAAAPDFVLLTACCMPDLLALCEFPRSGDKMPMLVSAIYPETFAEALFQVRQWLHNGSDGVDMRSLAREYAARLPSAQASYDAALADLRRTRFTDKDPGWPGIAQDLPPPMSKVVRSVMLKRKRMENECAKGPIYVDDDSDREASLGPPVRHERSQVYGTGLRFCRTCSSCLGLAFFRIHISSLHSHAAAGFPNQPDIPQAMAGQSLASVGIIPVLQLAVVCCSVSMLCFYLFNYCLYIVCYILIAGLVPFCQAVARPPSLLFLSFAVCGLWMSRIC